MKQERQNQQTNPLVIREQISTRTIEALMSNYRDSQQACFDLVDNAIDNRIEGKPITIRVRVSKEELSISNQGGLGLDFEGLNNYFTWGHSDKPDTKIGKFGVGGKAAVGFLGRGMEIICSKDESDKEYRVYDPTWETRQEDLKRYEAEERKATGQEGYFKIRVIDLKKDVNPQTLAAKIGDIYRPLLLDGSVKVTINGKVVTPLTINYVEDNPDLIPEVARVETRLGNKFMLRVGALEEGQKVKPGIRCYYKGRLIDDEQFFGHPGPAQMAGSSRLIGEAHLDFVPITSNKFTFDRSSVEWETASKAMNIVLRGWITKLETLRPEQKSQVERYEKDLAKSAKRILENALASTGLITKADLPGGSFGRLPPTPREIPLLPPTKVHATPKPTEGKTAPKLPAVGESIKRWGATHEVEPVSMGNDQTRAEIVDEDNRKKLRINSDFPPYQVAKKLGDDALEVYIAETIALEICKVVAKEKSVEDYTEMVNQLLSECGRIFRNKIADRRSRIR